MEPLPLRPEEWAVGALEPESVEQVLDSIAQHGVAVLHQAIPASVCELLQEPLYADAQRMLEGGFWPPQPERGALGHGHINLGPPRCGVNSCGTASPARSALAEEAAAAFLVRADC
jgi:hypothetical protein